jgi:hypothetical protein
MPDGGFEVSDLMWKPTEAEAPNEPDITDIFRSGVDRH